MKKKFIISTLLLILTVILTACQTPAQAPTPAASDTAAPPTNTLPPTATLTPTLTLSPTETLFPTWTPAPSLTPSSTPPTYVREGSALPIPNEPITAENAAQIVELARLGKGAIQEVQLSPNRLFLLVRTTIGIYGYYADTLEEAWAWEYPAGVTAMAVPDLDRWIAIATNDGRIALLVYQRGSMFSQWVSGYETITDLAFSSDGDMLAAIGDQGVTIWQVGKTVPLYEYPEIQGKKVRFTPDGESITIQEKDGLSFIEIKNGEIKKELAPLSYTLTYSIDEQQMTDSHTIWDTLNGELLIDLERPEDIFPTETRTFSQNRKYLAMGIDGEGKYSVGIWQVDTGNFLFILNNPYVSGTSFTNLSKIADPVQLSGPDPIYHQISFSPDGRLLAAAHPNGYVDLWDLETNVFIGRYTNLGTNIIFRKASRLTIWDNLEIHDIEPRNQILINSQRDFVAGRKLNFSPDGRWLFADWVVWDLNDLKRAFRLGDEIVSTISSDSEYLYSYDFYDHIIYKRRISDFGLVEQIKLTWDFYDFFSVFFPNAWGHQDTHIAISPTGKYFSTSIYDSGNQTWNLETNELIPEFNIAYNSDTQHIYSSDGKLLIIKTLEETTIFQLEPEIQVIQEIPGTVCQLSPDGYHLLLQQNGIPLMYSLEENGQFIEEKILDMEIAGYFCAAAFQGEEIVAGATWTEITLADIQTGNALITLPAHLDEIASIAFSPDGKYLATSSYDGTVKIWGIQPGE